MRTISVLTLSVILISATPNIAGYGNIGPILPYSVFPRLSYIPLALPHRFGLIRTAAPSLVHHIYYPKSLQPQAPSTDYNQNLVQLSQLIESTFKDIGEIALNEDFTIGVRIGAILQNEVQKVHQILADYVSATATAPLTPASTRHLHLRYKRQANANSALNNMGDILVNSNSKIDAEKKMLSPNAQRRINRKYKDAVRNCSADSCKAAAKLLESVEDSEDERQ